MRAVQWAILTVGLFLMAVSFPRMFVRDDERHLVKDNFGLDVPDDADDTNSTGVFDAFVRALARRRTWAEFKRLPHDIKNVVHEWAKARPKLAAKFLPFLALCMGVVGFVVGVSV